MQKERNRKLEHQLHTTSEELETTRRELRRMKALDKDKNLGERDELSRKLSRAEADLEESMRKNEVRVASGVG